MGQKCTNDHEIAKGANFCGECGGGPKAEADRKCSKCEGSILKAQNFCPGCGEKAAPEGDAQWGVALEGLTAFAKAAIAIQADLKLPTIDPKVPDQKEVQAILKAATVATGKTGDEVGVDPEAVIIEVLKSHNVLAQKVDAYAGHHQTTLAHLVEGNGLLVKACIALGAMNRELSTQVGGLTAKIEELRNDPGGRKTARVTAIAKGGPASAAAQSGDGAGGEQIQLEKGDLLPEDVIAKCLAATEKDGALLSTHEFAKVTTMANGMGFTLKAMCEYDPALAPTLLAAIKKADQIAAAAEAAH